MIREWNEGRQVGWSVCSGQCEMESQRRIVGSPIVSRGHANTQAIVGRIVCVLVFVCVCVREGGE